MNNFDLSGRTAVITGGARGISHGIAARFLASGAKVAIWDMRVPEAFEGSPKVLFEKVDVTDAAAVDAAAGRMLTAFGKVDILVNGAGVTGPTGPVEAFDPVQWRRILAVDLESAFLVSRAFIPGMRAAGYGRIISIASVAGKEGNPGMAAYSAAKGGVIAFTKAVGRELAGTGVLVNCITPALIRTALLDEMSPEAIALSESKIPLGRLGTIQEAAAMATWMASEECGFTTGAAFDLSGGRSSF